MRTAALVAFIASSGLVAYVLLGYPLLLAVLARWWPLPPPRRDDRVRTVTVLMPVRNGARWLAGKLDSILAMDYPAEARQILVVDDGSTDETASVAEAYRDRGIELLRVPPGGKAAAINAGLGRATGEILFMTDVRQLLDRTALRTLVPFFGDPSVGAVSGELVIGRGETSEEANIGLYWTYEKWIRERQSQVASVPGATGCIYAIRRDLAQPLPHDCLVDDMHLPLAAYFRGTRLLFTPDARAYDFPTDLGAEFRRKVRTLAGNYQIVAAFPRLLAPTHRLWIHFLSHKVGRLMLPFALLVIAASTPLLPTSLALVAGAAQVAVYGLAAVDRNVPERTRLKRLTSPSRAFVSMMLAALVASRILFTGSHGFWTQTAVRTTAARS
jgi:cellulose synthase/poly-beta-1,6-N-acetylglucosamine synthase-like glycosyltransferase